MRILVSNDDGYDSEGLQELVRALSRRHEVYVSAPLTQRSATSHSVTYFRQKNLARRVEISGAAEAWAIDGTPADCVYYAIHGFMKDRRPDAVISGINYGRNMSSDCIYSGTVAAAGEGMIYGIPSMAVSLCDDHAEDFTCAAKAACDLLDVLVNDPDAGSYIMNVNVPAVPAEEIKGYRVTELDTKADYGKEIFFLEQEDGDYLLEVINKPPRSASPQMKENGDITAVRNGYISVTPLYYDLCAHQYKNQLKPAEDIEF